MRKFNCQWSSSNHWTPSSKDAIPTKTEISLQSHFYSGSSKPLNTSHLNTRYFLQKDVDVQTCQVQYVKIHGMTVLKNEIWILEPQNQQQSSGATEKKKQTGCCAEAREAKFVHKDVPLIMRQITFSVVVLQNGWFEVLQIISQQVIFSDRRGGIILPISSESKVY